MSGHGRAEMDPELHRAARAGPVSSLQALLANPHTRKVINAKDGMQRTALHVAAEEGARDKVLLLLQNGADPTATDRNMWTPLHCAASQGFLGLIEPLVDKGAPINAQTREGSPAISYLPKAEDTVDLYNSISFLIARGANPNLPNSHGEIALHKACFNGRMHAVRALIERGAHINAKAKGNETPLHFAIKAGRAPVVRLLLERGADPNAQGEYGSPTKLALASTFEVQQAMTETVSMPFIDIHLHDFAAVDLPRKTFGSVDSYIVVRLDAIEMRSDPVHKSNAPIFRFSPQMTYTFADLQSLADKNVHVELRDGSDIIGAVSLDLLSLTTGPSVMQNLSLLDHKGGGKGKKGRISFIAEVTYKRRCFVSLRNVVLRNLRPAANAPHVNWKNDVFLEAQINPMLPFRSPVVYNTYDPSWQELPALCICAGLKEMLGNKKIKFQAFNHYKGDAELLGECELDLKKIVLSSQVSQHFREDLTFRGAAYGSLDCQVSLQFAPDVAQLEGYRTDEGFVDTQPLTDFVVPPKGHTPSKPPQYVREAGQSIAGVPSDRGQRHRKVGDLVEMLKQNSQKATAELADLVWRDDTARDGFREENGFVVLAKLLGTEGDLQREAARLLLNALFEHTRNQEAFRLARGVPALVEALSHGRSAAQLSMVLSLAALAARDSFTQQAICDANGIPTLIGILQSNTGSHVKLVVASTLGKLCYSAGAATSSKIPDVIRLAGGMRALVELMAASDVDAELRPAVWETAILALKMLCDNSPDNLKAFPPLLGPLLSSPDQEIQLLVFSIIRDICSRNEDLTDLCVNSIGLARFLSALASPHEVVRTEALILFKQLFRKNSKAAPPSVDASSLAPCTALLQSNDPTVLRLVFKILKRLARTPAVAVELAVSGVVPRVVAHLRSPDAVMQKKALGLIALLAQEGKARESLHDLDFSLLTQFLGAENQKLQSLACNVATLLLGDSQRKHDLTRAGALPAVVKLLKGEDLALLATALQLLQGFSDAQENRPVLLDCGVMIGLESVIRLYGDSELLLPALAIIQSLCSSPKAEAAIVNSPILACFEVLLANPYPNPQARDAMQKILSTIGYSTGVCTQAHRANAAENLQQDFYHCVTCGVNQPGGICEGCALVCHKGHQLSAKYRDHILCTCGNAPNKLCQSLTLTKPVSPPLSVCAAAFGKTNRPQNLFRCRTCWADTPKYVCKRCSEDCHKGHQLDNMNTIAGVCSCNDRVYNKCSIFTVQKRDDRKPAAASQAAPAVSAAAAPPSAAKGDDKGDDAFCIICMDAPKEALFYKCGHIASCMGCASGMKGKPCPICRETILDVVKIFKI